MTWPALLLSDELPADGLLNGKADDFVTGGLVALLIIGLLAAGWLRPLWPALIAVAVLGLGVRVVCQALAPTRCPPGLSGIDCLPVSFSAVYAAPGLLLVLFGSLVRRAAGWPGVDLFSR